MMEMLKVGLYTLACTVSLVVVCLCALWKYDPMFTHMFTIKDPINSPGLLWNVTTLRYSNATTKMLVLVDATTGRPLTVQHHTSPSSPSSTSPAKAPPQHPSPPSSPLSTTSTPLSPPSLPPSKTPSLAFRSAELQPMTFGFLNYDVWNWIVGYLVDDMRIVREFPSYPDEHKNISKLHTVFNEVDPADVRGRYAHKIYGYLIPPKPGSYSFKVELTEVTAAVEVELWISTSSNSLNTSLILDLLHDDKNRTRTKVPTAKPRASKAAKAAAAKAAKEAKVVPTTKSKESKAVHLDSGPYYFEFFEKACDGKVIADVKWKTPSSSKYEAIPATSYAMAVKLGPLGKAGHVLGDLRHHLPLLSSNDLQTHHRVKAATDALYPVTDLNVLPGCEFRASYAQPRKVKLYTGFKQVHQSKVYPKDKTWFNNAKKADKGNPVIDESLKKQVVSLYEKALAASENVTGTVLGLHYMEETTNKNEGSRFLLEMDIQLHQPKEETVHTSEYVYLKKGSSQLCHTSNFQWTKAVEVHFVVSVKNLGLWVRHLIYNMEEIYSRTKDDHFSLIIVDYQSEDMNIEQEARKSSFKRIHVISLKGPFTRSGGLQTGVEYVTDENSIVMTIDMHLTLPVGFVEYVRKHTVQHKMGFTPMFFRLNKGYTEVNCDGFWETLTYGLYALYKSDWITFGGFNTKKYSTKWGGEDWDILDRALAKGFEAFRVRPPGLVHYHHTRKGMWGNSEVKLQKWTLHHSDSHNNTYGLI